MSCIHTTFEQHVSSSFHCDVKTANIFVGSGGGFSRKNKTKKTKKIQMGKRMAFEEKSVFTYQLIKRIIVRTRRLV